MTLAPETTNTEHRLVGTGHVGEGADRYDRLRATGSVFKVAEPDREYWVVLDHDLVRQCLQDATTFSSSVISPLNPEPPFAMIPIQLDPPEHTQWKMLLARYFSPRQMEALRPGLEARCRELIADIKARGECDLLHDFALKFPTAAFLELMGLPLDQLPTFLEWEKQITTPDDKGGFDEERQVGAMFAVVGYFAEEISRRRNAGTHTDDLLSDMLTWEIDGVPAPDDALINCCVLLFLAGLDTVTSTLAFSWHHLATHAADRAHVAATVARGEATDGIVEELLRYYAVPEVGRKVTRDVELDGHLLRAGDLVVFPLVTANRDGSFLADADRVVLDRAQAAPHLTFGAGPHRCVGSHLARIELNIALVEWHRELPDYVVPEGVEVSSYWGNIHGMYDLPLQVVDGADR
jgi:cytochrome P450